MTTVVVDLETWTSSVMSDTTGGIHPWQQDLINQTVGFKAGEMSIISAGRQTGKSFYQQYMNNVMHEMNRPTYKQMSFSKVDDAEWVTVQCNREIAAWVREQHQKYWYEHNNMKFGSSFDIHSKLYTLLKIKFTP
jgi:hypothetical protein